MLSDRMDQILTLRVVSFHEGYVILKIIYPQFHSCNTKSLDIDTIGLDWFSVCGEKAAQDLHSAAQFCLELCARLVGDRCARGISK